MKHTHIKTAEFGNINIVQKYMENLPYNCNYLMHEV